MTMGEKSTLLMLDVLFLVAAGAIALAGRLPDISPGLFWLLMGLAAYRLGRAVSYNLIFKWLRDGLGIEETPDSSGAGNSNNATGSGPRRILGELVCCPICSSTWAALFLLGLYAVYPTAGTVFVYALSAAGVAELLTWLSEYFEWGGRQSREAAGSYWQHKNIERTTYPEFKIEIDPETFKEVLR